MKTIVRRKLLQLALLGAGLFFALNCQAQTWTSNSLPVAYVATSADGTKLVAALGSFGLLYTSTNSGTSWITNNIPGGSLLSSSADGTKLVVGGGPNYISTNSGATWITNTFGIPAMDQPFSIVASADGSKVVALNFGTSVGCFVSTNYGLAWKSIAPPGNKAAISADGTKCYFASYNTTNIYVSTNLGTTWKKNGCPTNPILSVACSADGSKVVAATSALVFTSTNSGTNWIPTSAPKWTPTISPVTNWYFVASSADGTKLIAAARGTVPGPIYTSSDSGLTWVSNNVINEIWSAVASSADGGELLAVCPAANPRLIFSSKTTVPPQMKAIFTNSNLTLSWTVPSTNFVLQQSTDLTSWADVTNPPVLNMTNLQNQLTLITSNSSSFYRLKTP